MTSSQISAAGAYAQADRLVVSIPVRAIDPTRKRFEVEDQTAAGQAPVKSRQDPEESGDSGSQSGGEQSQGAATGGWGRSGFGLLGAFTSFLTRVFGQAAESAAAAATSAQAGVQAYARAAGGDVVPQDGGVEVLPPAYSRLSSGRAIDLTV